MFEALKQWDRDLFVWLNNLGVETYDSFWIFATHIESWSALFIYFFVLIFYFYGRKQGAVVALLLITLFLITLTITDLTKEYVVRLRPNNVAAITDLIRVLQKPTSYSFFSGHASSSFAITTFVVLALKPFNKLIYLAYLWPLIFVMSRIYVGVHYPSDIVVGAFVGIAFAFLFHFICVNILKKI